MARMYKQRKGKSGSTKPDATAHPEWSETDVAKVTELILSLHDEGKTTAEIGTLLRDLHAVPDVRLVLGKRIGAVISEARNPSEYPEDLMNLMKKAVALIEHVGSNPKDLHNKRSLGLTESKIRRLARYYIDEGRLPQEWRYRREEVRLMVN